MKLTVKTLVFVIASALAACSADEDAPIRGGVNNPDNSHLLPIKLAVGDAPQTRAADGLLKDNFPSGTDITVLIDGNEYSYKTNEPGKELTCTNNPIPYYAISGKSVSIKAFYPTLEKGWYNRTSFVWGVNTDQTSDDSYKASDKMYATVPSSYSGLDADGKVTPTKDIVPLKFYHLMSKVVLTITTPNANTKIYKVTLNSVKNRYRMDCVNCRAYDAHFDTNNTAGVITLYNNDAGATGTVTCAGVFPPQTISNDVNFITVKMTDYTLMYKLPETTTFIGGNTYSYNIGTTREGNNDMLVLSASEFTYNQQQQGPTITLKDGTRTLTEGTDYEFDTSSNNTATNAGDYTVKVKFKGIYSGTASKSWKIKKATPPYTAPQHVWLYPGMTTATNLVQAGSTSVGTMKYTLGTSEKCDETQWSDAVPKAKDPGVYYVWYKIVSSNSNYYTTAAMGPIMERIRKVPGQVICSDGWIGEYKDKGSRTPVAVVIRWGEDTGDATYNHGLAMALNDAQNGLKVKWSTENVKTNPVQVSSSSTYNSTTYPAFKAAFSNNSTPNPPGTSGWYLPSLPEFDQSMYELGRSSKERYDNMRGYFSSRGGTDLKMDFYWTSTENDASNATGFNFSTYIWYSASKQTSGYVRAILAF